MEAPLHKKLTITVDEDVYDGLHRVVGRQKISHFIEGLVRPHVIPGDLMAAYREMAEEEDREAEARDWAEAMVGDVADEAVRSGGSASIPLSEVRSKSGGRRSSSATTQPTSS
jgi:predicted CopG family antitoxin